MKLTQISKQRKTLGESAYKEIRDAIISLRLEPGQMVYENELASSLGVSRTPVREAFLMLLKEELIEILPQRGARVAYLSRKKVEEARFIRESLEVSAFREIAKSWNEEEEMYRNARAQAEDLLKQQQAAAAGGEYIPFLHSDEAFHNLFLGLTGNQTLLSVVFHMRGHLNRMRYLELKEAHHMTILIEQHEKLLRAVAGNDEQAAEQILMHHLRQLEPDIPKIIAKYAGYFKEDE